MNWFKKSKEQPKDWQTVSVFKSHSGPPMFALVRPALLNAASGIYQVAPPDLYPIPCAFAVSGGRYYDYTSESRLGLALISMPCVSEAGDVRYVQIRKLYLDYVVTLLAANVKLDVNRFFQTLVEGKRAIVAGVVATDPPKLIYSAPHEALDALLMPERHSAMKSGVTWLFYSESRSGFLIADAFGPLKTTEGEYFFSYTATTTSSDMEGVNELEGVVGYCYTHNLSTLPLPGRERWCTDFLRPALEHIQVKMKELEGIPHVVTKETQPINRFTMQLGKAGDSNWATLPVYVDEYPDNKFIVWATSEMLTSPQLKALAEGAANGIRQSRPGADVQVIYKEQEKRA
jgi:hypothetical protein